MADSLDIAQIAKLTGLTSRALRFYEARGLIKPLRSASGRRHYGPAELERLHQILALKRAGLSLAQIEKLTAGRKLDLRALVAAQIDALDAQRRELDKAKTLLATILSRIDRSEPIDVATFCSLIRHGDKIMTQEKSAEIRARYMTPEQMAEYDTIKDKLAPDFDPVAFRDGFKELQARIKAALPMDPASPEAQAFLDEWGVLVQPWLDAATPTMREGLRNLYAHFDEWQGEVEPFWDPDVFRFHQAAAQARGQASWNALQRRYMTQAQYDAVMARPTPEGIDPAEDYRKWRDLNDRINAALPMDPASPQAQDFLDEWQALIQPFVGTSSPDALAGFANFYEHIEEWEGETIPPFNAKAFRFHQAAARARCEMKA